VSTIVDVTWSLGPGWVLPGWVLPGWVLAGWVLAGWVLAGWVLAGWVLAGWVLPGWVAACLSEPHRGILELPPGSSWSCLLGPPGAASWVLLELPPGWSIVRLSDRGSCQVREAEIER